MILTAERMILECHRPHPSVCLTVSLRYFIENLGKLLLMHRFQSTLATQHNVLNAKKGLLLITFPSRALRVQFHYLDPNVFFYGSYLAPLLSLITDP